MIVPTSVLRRVYEPFLRRIPADDAWGERLRRAAERGAVIHVVRSVSLLDLLAIVHLSERFGLPVRLSGHSTERAIGFPFRRLAAEEGARFARVCAANTYLPTGDERVPRADRAAEERLHALGAEARRWSLPHAPRARSDAGSPVCGVYRPVLAVIAQGCKRIGLGDETYVYDSQH